MLKKIKQRWLNFILHLSSIIYNKKVKLLSTDGFKTFIVLFQLIFWQILIVTVSFPTYFFVTKAEVELEFASKKEVRAYFLRSKLTFVILGLLVAMILFKVYSDTYLWYQ